MDEQLIKRLEAKEQECKELKEKVKELHQGWIDCDKERNLQEANSEFRQRVINRYKQTLTEIKEYCEEQNLKADWTACEILQKISKVLDNWRTRENLLFKENTNDR